MQSTMPLSTLWINPAINARTVNPEDVGDIKAAIKAKGLKGTMWARPAGDLIDGQRRKLALDQLLAEGWFQTPPDIPVTIMDVSDAEALELSLLSVEVRRDLTPADQATTFYRLKLSGMAEADIAAHFAVSEKLVAQRLAIGSLSPAVIAALRAGDIDLRCATAFTLGKSHAHQEQVLNDLVASDNLYENAVRKAFTANSLQARDPRCQFVGEAAYEAAGGTITRDLFSEQASFEDAGLVQKLFDEKIAITATGLKAEGWAFVDVLQGREAEKIHNWTQLPAKGARELSEADLAALAAAQKCMDELIAIEEQEGGLDEDQQEEAEAVQESIALFEAKPYTPKQIKKSGCVILVTDYNLVEIRRGMLKPQVGEKAGRAAPAPDLEGEATPAQVVDAVDYTETVNKILCETAQNAVKLAMVTLKPVLAYRMGLAARLLAAAGRSHEAPFQLAHQKTQSGGTYAEARMAKFEGKEHPSFADMLAHLELLDAEQVIQLEAWLAADVLNFASLKSADVQAVLALLDPDMKAEGWAPDAEFLKLLSRKQIDLILAEIDPTVRPFKGKKPELLDYAAAQVAASNWLPAPLRGANYQGPGSAHWQEAIAAATSPEEQAA